MTNHNAYIVTGGHLTPMQRVKLENANFSKEGIIDNLHKLPDNEEYKQYIQDIVDSIPNKINNIVINISYNEGEVKQIIIHDESIEQFIETIKNNLKLENKVISIIRHNNKDIQQLKNENIKSLSNGIIMVYTLTLIPYIDFHKFLFEKVTYIRNISKYKPCATIEGDDNGFRQLWAQYTQNQKIIILQNLSKELTEKLGYNMDISYVDNTTSERYIPTFYSKYYIEILSNIFGYTFNKGIDIIANRSVHHKPLTEEMDFIYIAYGDISNSINKISDLTEHGIEKYKTYNKLIDIVNNKSNNNQHGGYLTPEQREKLIKAKFEQSVIDDLHKLPDNEMYVQYIEDIINSVPIKLIIKYDAEEQKEIDVHYKTFGELIANIKDKLKEQNKEIHRMTSKGKNLLKEQYIDIKDLTDGLLWIMTITPISYNDFHDFLLTKTYIKSISKYKACATIENDIGDFHHYWNKYTKHEKDIIMENTSKNLTDKLGYNIIIDIIDNNTNKKYMTTFYSKYYIELLSNIYGYHLDKGIDIVANRSIIHQNGSIELDFIFIAYGDLGHGGAFDKQISDLTSDGQNKYELYLKSVNNGTTNKDHILITNILTKIKTILGIKNTLEKIEL